MKNLTTLLIGLALVGFTFSCKSKKPIAPKGEQEIVVHCSGPDFFSNDKFFRANAVGESLDQATAKKKALANAKQQLASSINTTIKAVTDNYVNSREFNNKEEVLERFESLGREVINQELAGVRTICEKTFKTAEGKYKTYIAIEQSGEDLVEAINERLSKNQKLQIDYDYEKFKKEFEKEMKQFSQQQ
ncbi:MAG: hypothetical protein GY827_10315 [Cytophagales bacterium]|nr:hypothetical protein [Cytophagales bacterium]